MPLDDKQQEALRGWLETKCPSPICPSCGSQGPYYAADLLAPFVINPSDKGNQFDIMMGVTVPLVPIICSNCAYVRLYSAIQIGLLKPPDKSSESPAADST